MDSTGAGIANLGLTNAAGIDRVAGADVFWTHEAFDTHIFFALIEGEHFLALHPEIAILIDARNDDGHFAGDGVALVGRAVAGEF